MDDVKKPFRQADKNVNAARRDVDGNDIRDDLESLRAEIRFWVGKAADDLRASLPNVEGEAYRHHPN
jgi:hypothetical protein